MNARMFAYTALRKICLENTYSNLYLRKELDKADAKDKGFITQLVYGTLQNYRFCRYQWEVYAKHLPKDEIALLLDMSVYQLLCMDKVPTYAIINEAVEIAKKVHQQQVGNLVNAILHKVVQNGKRDIVGNEVEQLAIETSHPDWIVFMWKTQYGLSTAKQICYSNMEIKPQCARVNTLKTTKEALLKEELFVEGEMSEDALLYQGDSLVHTTYYQEGLLAIQDEASQLVAILLDPQKNERILDVCAAPGTKSTHIAQRMQNEGTVICGDIHEHRVKLIEEGATRLGVHILDARVMDARILEGLEEGSFDRVLCDVPCSGYGVLARKSDIKYHMKSEDMDTLIPLQAEILKKAATMVKTGGILLYSTCTLNKKENEKQIQKFLQEHDTYEVVEERTVFPFEVHSDGFYMAKMKKIR